MKHLHRILFTLLIGFSGLLGFSGFVTGGPATELTANASVSSAQLLAMTDTAQLTLIQALGAGTMIIIDNWQFELIAGANAYTGGASLDLFYGVPSNGVAAAIGPSPLLMQSASNSLGYAPGNSVITGVPPSQAVNQPVGLGFSTASSYACSGTCGTLNYWIEYHVITGLQ